MLYGGYFFIFLPDTYFFLLHHGEYNLLLLFYITVLFFQAPYAPAELGNDETWGLNTLKND